MKSVQNDMTVGSPMKMILSFTFPIFWEMSSSSFIIWRML